MLGSIQLGNSTSSDNSALNGKVSRRYAISHSSCSLLRSFIGSTSHNQCSHDFISRLSKNREPAIFIQDDTLQTKHALFELICQDIHPISWRHIHRPRQELKLLGRGS